ncbi:MAG: type II secretory pathway, component PulD [Opitutae bacterium]|nr:type II secretory pathway, component PulD [Opitutae bacterium]
MAIALGLPVAVADEPASPTPPAQSALVGPIDIAGENIGQILSLIERWSGRTVLRPQNLPEATISLQMKKKVTQAEAVQAFETLLNMNGVALVPLGSQFLKVMPLAAAKSEAPQLIEGSTLGMTPSGQIASKLFQLEFLRVSELIPQIAGLLNPAGGAPVVFEKTNSALVTDSISNLQRVETLIVKLDRPLLAGLDAHFYQLRAARASEVVTQMKAMLGGALQAQLGAATSYSADDRTNQVALFADARLHPFFDHLMERLDVRADPNTRNEVIFLKHATAKDVASILSQLASGQNAAAKSGKTGSTSVVSEPSVAAKTPAAKPEQPAEAPAGSPAPSEPVHQFSSILTILPEERTNSIVVSGTLDDIHLIRELVDEMDIVLAQVRIEAVIVEVNLEDDATSGISSLGLNVTGNKLTGFGGEGAGFKVSNGTIDAETKDLAAVIALSTSPRKTKTNILSVPTIITTHNKEGKLFVGEERPVITSYVNSTASTNISSGYNSTVSYKDIGITLSVTPLIGPDGTVQLTIKQEVKDVLGTISIDGNEQPRIGSRTTESFVSAKNGEIIVLGGLQRASDTRSTNRLGPIPVIGDLLGTRTRGKVRSDLIFFLRPTVVGAPPSAAANVEKMLDKLSVQQREELRRLLKSIPSRAGGGFGAWFSRDSTSAAEGKGHDKR